MESLFYRYKFPSVLVVYQYITVCMYTVFVLIGYTAKEDLFCGSMDLTKSFDDPTPFCTITGMYIHSKKYCVTLTKHVTFVANQLLHADMHVRKEYYVMGSDCYMA